MNVKYFRNVYFDPFGRGSPSSYTRVELPGRLALPDYLLGQSYIHSLVPVKVSDLPLAHEVARPITVARWPPNQSGKLAELLLELGSYRHSAPYSTLR